MRWHFLAYKFGRLVMPWAILIALIAPLAMPHNLFRTGLLVLESLPLVLALANGFIPAGSRLKRLSSPARTFLVMNAAALCAIAVFFVPANLIWKPTEVAKESDKG